MDKGDILYCIKEVGHVFHSNYVGNTRVEPGRDEYLVDYEVGKSYSVSVNWDNFVTIWKPIRDAIKLGLSPNAKTDNIPFCFNKNNCSEHRFYLWDHFVTENEYKNIRRTKLIDKVLNDN